jgi:hypothetical protein
MRLATAVRSLVLAIAVLFVLSCGLGSHDGPTSPYCVDVAGTWDGTFTNSCGGSGSGPVVVAQIGCSFSAIIPGFGGGTVSGEINGRNAAFTLYFSTPCSGSATGTATVNTTRISGNFNGGASGFGCCNPVSGTFTLTR